MKELIARGQRLVDFAPCKDTYHSFTQRPVHSSFGWVKPVVEISQDGKK